MIKTEAQCALFVVGHCSPVGSPANSDGLIKGPSEQRAEAPLSR